jgi:hypothetical protein
MSLVYGAMKVMAFQGENHIRCKVMLEKTTENISSFNFFFLVLTYHTA